MAPPCADSPAVGDGCAETGAGGASGAGSPAAGDGAQRRRWAATSSSPPMIAALDSAPDSLADRLRSSLKTAIYKIK